MTVPAVPPADLLLDACSALRADLAMRDAAAPPGPAADAPPAPPNTEAVAAWLPLVVTLERAAQLPVRERAAHFRRTRPAWDAAGEACTEPRYAGLGARLARWRAADPRLPVVKAVLWAFEQPEAAGYTRLALAGYTALSRLLPADDVRQGYVLAQSARALRTLGDTDVATDRYRTSERLGATHRDRWLRVRSAIGLGSTYHYVGNYPAARVVFRRVLETGAPDVRFTAAAHQGVMLSAMAAKNWDEALSHGWHLLEAVRNGAFARAEALNLMAWLCRRIGRDLAATRAAQAALRAAVRPDQTITALQALVDVATATRDRALGGRYGVMLRNLIGGSAGPYQDARALLKLAGFEHMVGRREMAAADLGEARRIAHAYHYHELEFECDHLESTFEAAPADSGCELALVAEEECTEPVQLTDRSNKIVAQIIAFDVPESALAGV